MSTLLSLLILTTCVPVGAFAQMWKSQGGYTLPIFDSPSDVIYRGAEKGYATPIETYVATPMQAVELSGGERLEAFGLKGVGKDGDRILFGPEGFPRTLVSKEQFAANYEPAKIGPGWFQEKGTVQGVTVTKRGTTYEIERHGIYGHVVTIEPGDKMIFRNGEGIFGGGATLYLPVNYDAEKVVADASGITPQELRELVTHDTGKLFGEPDTYAKFARVRAERTYEGGELIETYLAMENRVETKNVAKAGDWIVTNPGGEKYIVPGDKFAKKYERALDLGEGWFKPTGGNQEFVQLKRDMNIIAPWGETQVLKKGAYVNVTDLTDIYGVAQAEFKDTYKSIRVMYQENLKGIRLLALKVEQKLYKKFPKYSGVFFKRVLANDTDFMIKRLEEQAAKKAEKNLAKASAKKTGLRVFGGALFGSAIYFGLTLATAPSAQGGTAHNASPRSEVIKQTVGKVKGLSGEQKDMLADIATFMDPNARPLILRSPELMDKMGEYSAIIQSKEFDVDSAAEFISDELVAIEMQGNTQNTVQAQVKSVLRS